MIEKGVSPTTYTFTSSATETNGYIPAETKSNLLGNGLNNTCPSSQSLGKGGGAVGLVGVVWAWVFRLVVLVCLFFSCLYVQLICFLFLFLRVYGKLL